MVVNALERGARAEVNQPTWVYNEDRDIGPKGMIDDNPSTQWEVGGNPAEIEAIFHLPRPARVVGDYIHVGGTGGNRDITKYHLMVRKNGKWVWATTIQGSVTGDGSPDAAHTFDEPITGQHFKAVITKHTAPGLCYDQCDVPTAEYQLKGKYIEWTRSVETFIRSCVYA